jgi:tetratricopeptide (TPR) repeat protein
MHEGIGTWWDLFLATARVCEKCGQHVRALTYADASLDHPRTPGSTALPMTRAMQQRIRGRCLASLGRTADAATAFEAAAELASKHELFFLEVLALRDFKLHILDAAGHGEHASRRLGQALRRLRNPESMSQLLMGLDAAQLIALAPPDSSYRLSFDGGGEAPPDASHHTVYEQQDPAEQRLRAELSVLKLKALKKRARESGVDEEQLEDADDANDVKSTVVQLIVDAVSAASGDPRPAPEPEPAPELNTAARKAELEAMSVLALHKQAVSVGLDVTTTLKDAMASAAPKQELVRLLLAVPP